MIVCKSPAELERMRASNALVAAVLSDLLDLVVPGVTTADLNAVAEARVHEAGAVPAFKGYQGYPATLCASVNQAVVHGIPSKRLLVEGDIVSLDMGVLLDGYYGDSALTVGVGAISARAAELLRVTEEALLRAIKQARVGRRVSDLGYAIQQHVEAHGFSVVREFVGHGIGAKLHEEPQIPNYGDPRPGTAPCRRHGAGHRADGQYGPAVRQGPRGWVDSRDTRRQPVGALRAYRGDHDGGSRGADRIRTRRGAATGDRGVRRVACGEPLNTRVDVDH